MAFTVLMRWSRNWLVYSYLLVVSYLKHEESEAYQEHTSG